jgi:hypothetical protein
MQSHYPRRRLLWLPIELPSRSTTSLIGIKLMPPVRQDQQGDGGAVISTLAIVGRFHQANLMRWPEVWSR